MFTKIFGTKSTLNFLDRKQLSCISETENYRTEGSKQIFKKTFPYT